MFHNFFRRSATLLDIEMQAPTSSQPTDIEMQEPPTIFQTFQPDIEMLRPTFHSNVAERSFQTKQVTDTDFERDAEIDRQPKVVTQAAPSTPEVGQGQDQPIDRQEAAGIELSRVALVQPDAGTQVEQVEAAAHPQIDDTREQAAETGAGTAKPLASSSSKSANGIGSSESANGVGARKHHLEDDDEVR